MAGTEAGHDDRGKTIPSILQPKDFPRTALRFREDGEIGQAMMPYNFGV
jgi:hypothetical protein